jgi:DNA transformation protein
MAYDEGLFEWVVEAMEPLGRVSMRRMMGGATLYLDGTVFAILVEDELWLKSDSAADALWDSEGCERFTMTFKDGKVDTMNYRRAPLDVYDDADALRGWAALAVEAGLRAAAKKKPARRRAAPPAGPRSN